MTRRELFLLGRRLLVLIMGGDSWVDAGGYALAGVFTLD